MPKNTKSFSKPAGRTSQSQMDEAVHALQARVADRVRTARRSKGLPRRVVSEVSGVSQRYLAQLESGTGNISIGLLLRVANALDQRIDRLLGPEDPWTSETLKVADLFAEATPETRSAVHALLDANALSPSRAKRICLIGLRGAGKSTLGPLMSAEFDVPFLELNREVEAIGGMPVAELLAFYGLDGFRQLERQALEQVVQRHDRVILAAAGGIVEEPRTFDNLLKHFNTVWIKASAKEHMDRVLAQGDHRPMADNPEAMHQLTTILQGREDLYKQSQFELDTSYLSVNSAAKRLAKIIQDAGFLAS
ncbi:MAG: helix-turn-helix transcriptional regulator [Pseudomonadota bacterium]